MVKTTESITEASGAKTEKRKPVAEHDLLGQDRQPLPDGKGEESAYGISYKLLANGKVFSWHWGEANDDERRMLACFGAKTLATNVTSAERTADSDADGQFEAIGERFSGIRNGQWVGPREAGPRVNREALAYAICDVLVSKGRLQADAIGGPGEGGEFDARLARLNSDEKNAAGDTYLTQVRTNPEIAAAYSVRVGKKTASLDDIM